uniref:Uncharacterized protein n=1 Tax=Rangifer tarandus platyrhynchus TaxID=3082113 RepID=A0ACB0EP44_RANTA|nr:unnamed protein product [Rangifer tarandus platyrhynchus]
MVGKRRGSHAGRDTPARQRAGLCLKPGGSNAQSPTGAEIKGGAVARWPAQHTRGSQGCVYLNAAAGQAQDAVCRRRCEGGAHAAPASTLQILAHEAWHPAGGAPDGGGEPPCRSKPVPGAPRPACAVSQERLTPTLSGERRAAPGLCGTTAVSEAAGRTGRRSPPGVSQVWTTDGTQKGRRAWPGLHFSCPACPRASPGGPEACCPGRLSEHSCSLLGGGCGRRVDGKARGQQRDRPSGRGDGTCLFHSQQPSAFSSKSTTGPRVCTAAGKPALRRPSQDPQQSPWPPRTREAPASGDDRDTGRPCHWALGGRLALREALRPAPGAPPDAKLGVRLHLARPDTARLPRPRPVHLNLQQEKQGPGGALLFRSRTADLWASEPRGALRLQS